MNNIEKLFTMCYEQKIYQEALKNLLIEKELITKNEFAEAVKKITISEEHIKEMVYKDLKND